MTDAIAEKENIVSGTHEDDIRGFQAEIRQFPRLSADEVMSLAAACAKGDEDAIRTMVQSHLWLVVLISRKFANKGVPLLDLIQEGSISLLSAARNYDYTQQCSFTTYATQWIRQGMDRYVLEHADLIRVPLHTKEKIRKVNAVRLALEKETGEKPELSDIARRCSMEESEVQKYLDYSYQFCSLDAPAGEDGTFLLLLEDEQTLQPYQEAVRRELRQTLDSMLGLLTEKQQSVLRLRYGLDTGICLSFEQIGKQLGISKEGARQVEERAMERLKRLGAVSGLEEFRG